MCTNYFTRTCVMTVAVILAGTGATAQEIPATGGRVFGLVGGSFGDGNSSPLVSGGAGLRLTRHVGVDFEVFHVSGLELRDTDRFFIQTLTFAPVTRKAALTTFLTRFTAEFPVGDRVITYVTGGGGIGRLSEKIDFGVDFLAEGSDSFPSRDRRPGGGVRPSIFPPQINRRSETGLVLTAGGGVDVRLWKGLAVGGEVRWVGLLANRDDFNFAHIASRVSYRF